MVYELCEDTVYAQRLPLVGEAGSRSETDEVELAKTPLFDIVPKAASTSSAPLGHLAAKAEGLHRALQRGRLFAYACKDRIVLKIKARTQGSLSEGAGSAKGRD